MSVPLALVSHQPFPQFLRQSFVVGLHVIVDEEGDDGDSIDERGPLHPSRDAAVEPDRVPAPNDPDPELEELKETSPYK